MEKVCLNKGWLFKRVNDSEEKLINIMPKYQSDVLLARKFIDSLKL